MSGDIRVDQKTWLIKPGGASPVETVDDLKTLLFTQRGLSLDTASSFFEPDYERDIHDPYAMHGMKDAVDRIFHAIKKGEKIMVYGDYDADGITATATLVSTLNQLGAHVVPYLPHRMDDGYSLNKDVLTAHISEFDLLISADCGVSNIEEVSWLNEQGKDVIITDHHEMREVLPDAIAVLHPRHPDGDYPFKWLSGAGVAWKLSQALLRDARSDFSDDLSHEKWLLDFTVMGTLADVVSLTGENRAIVQFGMQVLRRSKRPGIKALREKAGSLLSVQEVSWRMVPRLNAAGRMDHPQPAMDLLLAQTEQQADRLLAQLDGYNSQRQSVTRQLMKEAELQYDPDEPIVFAFNMDWPAGVVGLAAGKLASAYGKPAVVVGGNGSHPVGSARAPDGMNILKVLRVAEEHVMKMGGHAQAAGFSVAEECVSDFREAIMAAARAADMSNEHAGLMSADAITSHGLLDWQAVDLLDQFEPFGEGNPKPAFVAKRLGLLDVRPVGKKAEHAKLLLETEAGQVDAIGFGMMDDVSKISRYCDALFHLEINEYRGRRSLQLNIQDIVPGGKVQLRELSQ